MYTKELIAFPCPCISQWNQSLLTVEFHKVWSLVIEFSIQNSSICQIRTPAECFKQTASTALANFSRNKCHCDANENYCIPLVLSRSQFYWHLKGFLLVQVILFEIHCAIFYTKLHELFSQFISWTYWVNSGKSMDNCWISCQIMADVKKV